MTTMADLLSTYTTQAEMSSFFTSNLSIYNVKSYDATGNGSTDDYNTVNNCVNDADDDGGIVIFPAGDYKISSDLTIPANVTVWFVDGARILPDSGKTITINGSLIAPISPIFAGNGTIILNGNIDRIYPQWWGASGDGDTTTTGSITSGSNTLTVASASTWKVGHGILVAGAGAASADLTTTVTAIDGVTFTLEDAASTTVAGAAVYHDDTVAFATAILNNGNINLPEGVFILSSSIYLIADTINLTYHLKGSGKQTILKPYGLVDEYMFKLNEDSNGNKVLSFPRHPRLILENLTVDGSLSTSANLLWFNEASFQLKNLILSNLKYGAQGTGYTDLIVLDYIYWVNPVSGGWLYNQSDDGDGLFAKQLFALDVDMISLKYARGAQFCNCIGGHYVFDQCSSIIFNSAHCEYANNGYVLYIKNSDITIDRCWLRNDSASYSPIYINDNNAISQNSNIVVSNNSFNRNFLTTTGRPADIYINNLKTSSVISLNNNTSQSFEALGGESTLFATFGIKISSAISALNNELLAKQSRFSELLLIFYRESSWRVCPIGKNGFDLFFITDPTISAISEDINTIGSLPSTTYYYKAVLYDINYSHSNASAENSIAKTSPTSTIKLTIDAQPYTYLRLYRGTASGNYDKYVQIPITNSSFVIYDTGLASGYSWLSSPPSVATSNNTFNGYLNVFSTNKIIYATTIPTVGDFVIGDICINKDVMLGEPVSWICITAGNPGTWKVYGQCENRSGSVSPIGSIVPFFIGEEYLDSTAKIWYKSTGLTNTDWVALN